MSDEATILEEIEQRIAQAWLSRDRAYLDGVLDDDWSTTDASGRVLTKEQVMREAFEGQERTIDSMSIDDVRVRIFGDTAVVTGRTRAAGSYQGSAVSVVLRFTDVLVRRSGRWRVVASHGSNVLSP